MSERLDLKNESWLRGSDWHASEGALDLWKVSLRARDDDWSLLTLDERTRADRRVIVAKREQLVAGRAALRRILGLYTGVHPAELRFDYGKHGRPGLLQPRSEKPEKPLPFDFNLSHSEDMALVGISPCGRIGVDVEWQRLGRPYDRLARRFFSTREHEEYESLAEVDRIEAFYQTWCRKEAYLKAWGTGLSFSSRAFTVAINPPHDPWLRSTEMPGDRPRNWSIVDLLLGQHYRAAACFEGRPDRIRMFEYDSPIELEVSSRG